MESGFLTELITCLQGTLSADPNERKQAEAYIKTIETRQSYCTCLLHLVQDDSLPVPTRLAAAITFKNFVKNFWKNVCCMLYSDLSIIWLSRSSYKGVLRNLRYPHRVRLTTDNHETCENINVMLEIEGREDIG